MENIQRFPLLIISCKRRKRRNRLIQDRSKRQTKHNRQTERVLLAAGCAPQPKDQNITKLAKSKRPAKRRSVAAPKQIEGLESAKKVAAAGVVPKIKIELRPRLDESVCRVCLHARGSVALFDGCGADEQFRYCTLLEADEADGLPGRLCAACADHMRIAYDFRFQAKYAEEYFRKTTPSGKTLLKKEDVISDDDQEFQTDEDETTTLDRDAMRQKRVLEEQVQEIDKLLAQHSSVAGGGSELESPNAFTSETEILVEGIDAGEGFGEHEPMVTNDAAEDDSDDDALSDHFVEAFAASNKTVSNKTYSLRKAAESSSTPTTTTNRALPPNVSAVVSQILETSREENDKLMLKAKEQRKSGKVECNICGTTFTHINSLRQHLMKHSGERPFGCDFCNKTFTRRTILNIHRRLHTGDRPYGCDECVNTFVTKEALNRHKQRDHKEKDEDEEALTVAPMDNAAVANNSTEHSEQLSASLSSPVRTRSSCSKPVNAPNACRVNGAKRRGRKPGHHQRPIEKPRHSRARMLDKYGKPLPSVKYCKICQLGFPSKWALFAHQDSHALTQMYECEVCQRSFEKKYSLLYHLQTHENAEELVQKCIRTPKVAENVPVEDDDDAIDNMPLAQRIQRAAQRKLLKTSGDKRKCWAPYERRKLMGGEYKCLVCQKIFTTSGSLKAHLRTHSGDRPFACADCGKRFTRSNILNIHRRQHTGERPYKCPLCPEAVITKDHLVRHVFKFHEGGGIDFPHTCETCFKTFPSNELLRKHLQEEQHATIATGGDAGAAVGDGTSTTTRILNCKLCSQEFATWQEFSNHIGVHDVPKPFQCGICQMRFDKKVKLLFHLEMHSARKKCKCKHCGEMLTRVDLPKHIKSEHFDKSHLDTPCPECPEMLYDICDLKQHLNEKHDFKDFNCEKCGSDFPTFVAFEKHFSEQHDSINKVCSECAEAFHSRKAYERHVWMHYV